MSKTELTTAIVTSYLEHNRLEVAELEPLIRAVHGALAGLGTELAQPETQGPATPAQIRRSIQPQALISFVDGKPYKLLRRHLTRHGLTPAEYRQRFGLPRDYPMTAPAYAAKRSDIAKASGLGTQGRGPGRPRGES